MRPLLVLLVALHVAASNPIIIRSGVSKDHAHQEDSNIFDLANIKGISNFEAEEGFNRDNQKKYAAAQDSGKYDEESNQKNAHSNENNFNDEAFHQQGGDQFSNLGKKVSHKKGHHKSGYTKSYHKDESASNSSYYDDEDDEGDEYVRDVKKNAYGDAAQQNRRGSDLDDRRYAQDQAKRGHYDTAGNYEKDVGNQRDYHLKKYYDNKENLGRRNAANQHGQADRYDEEKFVKTPHYYHQEPHYYEEDAYYNHQPVAPKKTITIYEDPRYDLSAGYEAYPHYDSDYVQLDVRRPVRDYTDYRYYDRRPSYDYYY